MTTPDRRDSVFQQRLDGWQTTRDAGDFTMSLQIDPRSDTAMGDLYRLVDAVNAQAGVYGIDVNEPSRRFGQSSVALAAQAQKHGVEGIPHITCRRDHNSIANEILAAVAFGGLRKVLVMSGDEPNQHLARMLGRYRRLDNLGITRRVQTALPSDEAAELLGLMRQALHNPDGNVLELLRTLDAIRRGEYMGRRSMPRVRFAIGVVYDHTLEGQALVKEQDRLRAKRDARANSVWGQPVFTMGQLEQLLETTQGIWEGPLLPGVWALESKQKARRLNAKVPGVVVPQEIIDKLPDESADAETREAVGRELANELRYRIIDGKLCAGVYLVAPLREPWNTLKMLNGH